MAVEIERKFLVDELLLKPHLTDGIAFKQGYIPTRDLTTVRVRIAGEIAFVTIKGKTEGCSRSEFEYEIPVCDAEEMLEQFCENPIIKKRFLIPVEEHTFEVDIFEGDNHGLTIAEVELGSENELVKLPEWVTTEVTGNSRYYNSSLAKNPYCSW